MVDTIPSQRDSVARAQPAEPGRVPNLAGDIRHMIPKLGLRNYWYPAVPLRRVPKGRPVKVSLLGEDLVFFRTKDNQNAVALTDVCPHRGARLSEGHVHWPGTVSCPYHGWTFDENGKNVAVLSEGPDSKVCGKPGTEAKKYPTRLIKGVVFIWVGNTEPAPIEEDLPEEFFRPSAHFLYNDHIIWNTNWLVALENAMDAHVGYLHRDSLEALLAADNGAAPGTEGYRPIFTGNGFRSGRTGGIRRPNEQDVYANGRIWPKHRRRRWWSWVFVPMVSLTRVASPVPRDQHRWGGGHRLPGMFRFGIPPTSRGFFRKSDGGLFGLYTRWPVALGPWKTRLWYFHWTEPKTVLHRWWYEFLYNTMSRWLGEYNFSAQDGSMMFNQRYDTPEKLSGTDAEVIQWRRLVVTKAYGGRNAPFEYDRDRDVGIEERTAGAPGGSKFGRDMGAH